MRVPLANLGRVARVCDPCYDELNPDSAASSRRSSTSSTSSRHSHSDKHSDGVSPLRQRSTMLFRKVSSVGSKLRKDVIGSPRGDQPETLNLVITRNDDAPAPPLPAKTKKKKPLPPPPIQIDAAPTVGVVATAAAEEEEEERRVEHDSDDESSSEDAPPPAPTPGTSMVRCLYDYEACEDAELSLNVNLFVLFIFFYLFILSNFVRLVDRLEMF